MLKSSYLREVISSLPLAVVIFLGEDLEIIACSEKQLELWGKNRGDVVGRSAKELVSADRVTVLQNVVSSGVREIRNGIKFNFIRQGVSHTGIYDYIYQPWKDDKGMVVGVIAVINDVTESRQEKEKVELLTRNLLHLANAMPQLVWIAKPDGTVTYYNDRLSLFNGARRLPDGSWAWDGLLHQKDLGDTQLAWDQALRSGEQYQAEHRIMMADKSFRWHLSRALPQKDETGVIVQWYGTATDIHELKVAEEEIRKKEKRLRLSETNFRKLAHSLPQMIWTTDELGVPDFFNDRWYSFTGTMVSEQGFDWRAFVHPEDDRTVSAIVRTSIHGSAGTGDTDIRIRDKAGHYSWFNLLVTAVYDEQNSFVKLIGTLTNIDDRKSMEEQLKLLVEQRTQELERSNQDLSQFAHITSHDLKEPLRKMKSFSFRLRDELEGQLSEKGAGYLMKIQNAAERLSSMVDGILEYSQVGSQKLSLDHLDMEVLIADILQDFELVMREKNAVVSYAGLHNVFGSRIQIRQLFYNLLNNAFKFSKPGIAPNIQIKSELNESDKSIMYAVIDNGIGFMPEYSERIFETFYRLHPKDLYEGTGLGLALCRKIVMRHGGTLTALSDGSSGSVFTVTLPLQVALDNN